MDIKIIIFLLFGIFTVYFLKSFMILLLFIGVLGFLVVLHFLNKKVKCCDKLSGILCDQNTKNCDDPDCVDDEKCGKRTCNKTCDNITSCVKCSDSAWCRKHQTEICNQT